MSLDHRRNSPPGRAFRTLTVMGVLFAVIAFATSCGKTVDGRAVIEQLQVGAIRWGDCTVNGATATDLPPGTQCGKIGVPVDYAKKDGARASLFLVRFPATGKKIGSLVINPGGPGESGVQAASSIVRSLPKEIREQFDLVGFDPRGVSGSSPALWCNSDADNDRLRALPLVDYSPEGVAKIEQLNKEFIQRCVDKMGTEFLANIGTVSVAKDLDLLRGALGDDKLTYLGYSYGTRIGATYAEMFPDKVRALVLDGAVDPNADPIEADVRQAAAFQKAFDDYAADCAKSPDCPLGTDPAKAVEVYQSLINPLLEKPAPTEDPRGLSYNDAQVGTILALYSPSYWKRLTEGLTELKEGKGNTLLLLSDVYMGRDSKGHYNNSTDSRVAVNCVDKPAITDRTKVIDQDRRLRDAAPFLSYGAFTGNAPLGTCAFWPVPPTSTPHELKIQGLPKTLVISTTNDPATPYQAGVDLARQLGAALLTFEGTQHTIAFQQNACVDDIVTKYLVDPSAPLENATC